MPDRQNLLNLAAEWRQIGCPFDAADLDLVRMLGEGWTVREIAESIGETYYTTAGRAAAARVRLGVREKSQAVLICVYAEWLQGDDFEVIGPRPAAGGA